MYKVVEGLVPAMPSANFIEFNPPGRQIRSKRNSDYITNNPIENYTRNNEKSIKIRTSNTNQYRNSFFIKTAVDWNHLNNPTVQSKTLESFKTRDLVSCRDAIKKGRFRHFGGPKIRVWKMAAMFWVALFSVYF